VTARPEASKTRSRPTLGIPNGIERPGPDRRQPARRHARLGRDRPSVCPRVSKTRSRPTLGIPSGIEDVVATDPRCTQRYRRRGRDRPSVYPTVSKPRSRPTLVYPTVSKTRSRPASGVTADGAARFAAPDLRAPRMRGPGSMRSPRLRGRRIVPCVRRRAPRRTAGTLARGASANRRCIHVAAGGAVLHDLGARGRSQHGASARCAASVGALGATARFSTHARHPFGRRPARRVRG